MGLMDKCLPLSLKALGGASLVPPHSIGNLSSQDSGLGGRAGLGGCPRAESPGRASGRQAPGAVLVPEHQRRELCFTEVLILVPYHAVV